MRPLIGIPCRTLPEERETIVQHSALALADSWAIEAGGGSPVALPLSLREETLRDIFSHLDGLLLTGGPDVHPHRYGADVDPLCGAIDPLRDETEIFLARLTLESAKPILAICRGAQLLNVAAGGTLHQHIPATLQTEIHHDQPDERAKDRVHSVRIEAGSRLEKIFGSTSLEVNSLHHQAIDRVAVGFRVTALSSDDVIEAIESTDERFFVGVQFHPEHLADSDPQMLALFKEFTAACTKRSTVPSRPAAAVS